MAENATLIYHGKELVLPVIEGSENEKALDISKLRSETGLITLDEGYKNTGSTRSAITFLDGEQGILRHRGYSIEDLADKANFIGVAYLLIYGELPNKVQYQDFSQKITRHTMVNEDMRKIFDGFPVNAHPMGIMSSLISAMSGFYPDSYESSSNGTDVDTHIIRLMAKFPTIAAWCFKKSSGHPTNYPKNSLDYTSNFLHMMFALPVEEYQIDPVVSAALNKLLILHADHEQNCSTSTVRLVGSSQANIYSSISAGISALWGPLHGGANQEVIEMLEEIRLSGGDIQKFVDKAKDKSSGYRLFGFGHRVYKNFDPRAKIIKKAADDVLNKLGINDPVLEIAKGLEEKVLNDEYFISRKLYPNVDFYSGIIYRALGIPTNMFTVMFALGRLPGWIAQWKELREQKQTIGRPRQVYTGSMLREFLELEKRM